MWYSSRVVVIFVIGMLVGIVVIMIVLNIFRLLGIWLMMLVIVVVVKILINVMKDGLLLGSKIYKVVVVIMVLIVVKNSCVRMICMFGMVSVNCWNLNGDLWVVSYMMLFVIEVVYRIDIYWIVVGLSGVVVLIVLGKKFSVIRLINVMLMFIVIDIYFDKVVILKVFSFVVV